MRSRGIDFEFNVPYEGINRRAAGVFLRDESGRLYAGHSGRLGGALRGTGKAAFVAHYRGGNFAQVYWPDGVTTEMILIAELGSRRMLDQLAQFASEVKRYKRWAKAGQLEQVLVKPLTFTPEPFGPRQYTLQRTVESYADHGLVVNALAQELARMGLTIGSDRSRDLVVTGARGQIRILFEAKTEVTLSSLYQGVGQLMLNGTAGGGQPALVLVLPGRPKQQIQDALAALGIRVLTYTWEKGVPRFMDLPSVL